MAVSKKLKSYFDNSNVGNCFCDCKYNTRFNKWEVVELMKMLKLQQLYKK